MVTELLIHNLIEQMEHFEEHLRKLPAVPYPTIATPAGQSTGLPAQLADPAKVSASRNLVGPVSRKPAKVRTLEMSKADAERGAGSTNAS